MLHYYETGKDGELHAFDTFEEAETFANENGCEMISEIGGSYTDFVKCSWCGDWTDSNELNADGDCRRCEEAIKSHWNYK